MSLSNILFINVLSIFDLLLLISFIFILGVLFAANYYDLKYNIVPNYLVKLLFSFGLIINVSLAILFKSLTFLLFSFVLAFIVFIFSFLLWMLKFWAGGDVKIFSALAFSSSFLQKDFILNHLNIINHYSSSYIANNLIIFNQFTIYPKVFSILLNGILLYLPLVFLIIVIRIFKSNLNLKNKGQMSYLSNLLMLMIFNFSKIIKLSTINSVDILDLKEGMLLDKYYFDDERVFNKIKDLNEDYNLVSHKAGRYEKGFYLASGTAAGLTLDDLDFLKSLYDEGLIKSPKFNIKLTIPFLPSLTLGFIVMMIWGDLISLVSSFI